MATVIPNPLSGVGDAALGYLDTVMSKRRMRLEEEDLALRRQMQGRLLIHYLNYYLMIHL